jgi:PAS domain S-box-containing protein
MWRASQSFKTLQENQHRLTQAQDLAQLGYWEWRPDRDELLISGPITRLFGSRTREVRLTLADFLDFIHPQEKDSLAAALQAARDAGRPFKRDQRIILPGSGIQAMTHVQARVSLPKLGGAPKITGTIQDITQRKKVEQELRRYRRRLDRLEAHHPEDVHECQRLFQKLLAGERDFYQRECRHRHQDGRNVWVKSQVCRVRGPRGGTSFTLAMLQDITREKRMQKELNAY